MELRISIIMFKVYHNLLPTYVQQFFSQPEFVNATRQNYTFNQTFAHTNFFFVGMFNFSNNYEANMLNRYVSDV